MVSTRPLRTAPRLSMCARLVLLSPRVEWAPTRPRPVCATPVFTGLVMPVPNAPRATGVDSEKVFSAHWVQASPFQYRPASHRQASGVSDPAKLVEKSGQATHTSKLSPLATGVDSEKVFSAHWVQASPFQYRPVAHRQVSEPSKLYVPRAQGIQLSPTWYEFAGHFSHLSRLAVGILPASHILHDD